jgi:hypothetical protein
MLGTNPENIGQHMLKILAEGGVVGKNGVLGGLDGKYYRRYDVPGDFPTASAWQREEAVENARTITDLENDQLMFRFGEEFFSLDGLVGLSAFHRDAEIRAEASQLLQEAIPTAIQWAQLRRG